MVYTLYDDLMNKKYFVTEALKNGIPDGGYYNQWVFEDILKNYLSFNFDDILSKGVYSLGFAQFNFYIGRTGRPILLRAIDHLFDTIPTVKCDIKTTNQDKIMVIKTFLMLDEPMFVKKLSDDPEDEEHIIKEMQKTCSLVNKQFCDYPNSYYEFMEKYFEAHGDWHFIGDDQNIKEEDGLRVYFLKKYKVLLDRFGLNTYSSFVDAFVSGYNSAKDYKDMKDGE